MTLTQFYFLFPALFMLHELEEIIWMPSFVKKLSAQFPDIRFLSYYTPFTFNAIVIAYIYHIFGHLIQTIVLRKYVPGLLTGIFTSLFSIAFLKIEISVKLYGYSFLTLLVIVLNLVVSFMILNKISHKK